jgi:5-methylcytosine-specific restriction endonuclease McrA
MADVALDPVFRIYGERVLEETGYPTAWTLLTPEAIHAWRAEHPDAGGLPSFSGSAKYPGIKDLVRAEAHHRCVRCLHPYVVGQSGEMSAPSPESAASKLIPGLPQGVLDRVLEEEADRRGWEQDDEALIKHARRTHWSPCDDLCAHPGPFGIRHHAGGVINPATDDDAAVLAAKMVGREPALFAAWRILTVHHLNGNKADCRWWNLAALCQRCHLVIQGKVSMERVFPWEHSTWFKPYAAGWYAHTYLGEALTRSQVMARLEELLMLERMA